MNLTRIRQAISIQHAISRYNDRFDSCFQIQHIRLLTILRIMDYPVNRLEILNFLAKRSLSMNYTQLDKAILLLLKESMLHEGNRRGLKSYTIAPAGIQLLLTLEKWIRKMRFDKVVLG